MSGSERTIVVGAGVAGLVAARERALAGREVLLLERAHRLGGQLQSHSVGGIDLDAGADAFTLRGAELPRLLRALGLDVDVERAQAAGGWLHRADGESLPLPAVNLLGIPGVPLARDVIDAIGMRAALRAQLDNLMPGLVASKAPTLDRLVQRRLGRGVLEGLVAPVVRASHAAPPAELGVEDAVPGLARRMLGTGSLSGAVRSRLADADGGGRACSLRGGLFRLAEALAAELERFGVAVRTGAEVAEADARGVLLTSGERLAGEVILAAPLGAPTTRVTLVTLAFDAPELASAPRGGGVAVAAGAPGIVAAGLAHLSARWPWLAEASPFQLVRLSYEATVEPTPELARSDAAALLGMPLPHPVDTATVSWERARRRTVAEHAIDGMHRVGEAESGTDLAAVVSYAGTLAGAIPSERERNEG